MEYIRDGLKQYVCFEAGKEKETYYEENMLLYNKLQYFLPFQIRTLDDCKYYYYETCSSRPIKDVFREEEVHIRQIEKLLYGLIGALEELERYMLDLDGIMLRPEHIFVEEKQERFLFLYHRGEKVPIMLQIKEFIEYLMQTADKADREGLYLLYGFYSMLTDSGNHLVDYRNYLDEQKKERFLSQKQCMLLSEAAGKYKINKQNKGNETGIHEKNVPFEEKEKCAKENIPSAFCMPENREKLSSKKEQREEKTEQYISGLGAPEQKKDNWKTALRQFFTEEKEESKEMENSLQSMLKQGEFEKKKVAVLVPKKKKYQQIVLGEEKKLVIGHDGKQADCCIWEDEISPVHAQIFHMEDCYFIVDMKSEKGTYLNGKRLSDQTPAAIYDGDEVAFGKIRYIFRC